MKNKEILEKAIQKAIDGGWVMKYHGSTLWNVRELSAVIIHNPNLHPIEPLIYNHDFAKAIWGEEEAGTEDFYSPEHNEFSGSSWPKWWEYHLREMVISDDPIKYLGKNI